MRYWDRQVEDRIQRIFYNFIYLWFYWMNSTVSWRVSVCRVRMEGGSPKWGLKLHSTETSNWSTCNYMYFAPPTVAVILVVDSNIVTTVVQVECISKGYLQHWPMRSRALKTMKAQRHIQYEIRREVLCSLQIHWEVEKICNKIKPIAEKHKVHYSRVEFQ